MAQNIEFNLICTKMLKIDCFPHTIIKQIICIDDWLWTNRRDCVDFSSMEDDLYNGKIYIVDLYSECIGDFGVFIEKKQGNYEYCFWVSSNTSLAMDEFGLTVGNMSQLKQFYNLLKNTHAELLISIQILGIGFETTFHYERDIQSTIERSEGIIIWIVNDSLDVGKSLHEYQKRILGSGLVAYEKWK